jgi:hypothetical protein
MNAMEAPNPNLFHLVGNRAGAIPSEPVDTGAHQKVRAKLMRGTE